MKRTACLDFLTDLGQRFTLDGDYENWIVKKDDVDDLLEKHFPSCFYSNFQDRPITERNLHKADWKLCVEMNGE